MAASVAKRLLGVMAVIILGVGTAQTQVTLTLSGTANYMIRGGNFTFTCVQTDTPESNTLVFFKDNPFTPPCGVTLSSPCQPDTSCGCVSQSGTTRTHRFVLQNVSSSHAGKWQCQVTGASSEGVPTFVSQPLSLTVFVVTPVQLPIADVLVKPGDTAIFSWTLPDLSGILVLYLFNASDVSKSIRIIPSANAIAGNGFDASRFTYLGDTRKSNMTFTLSDVTVWDAGWYRCGRNGVSTVIPDCGQRLVVLGPPSPPSLTSSNTTVLEGSDVNMTCHSTSSSVPPDHGLTLTYIWTRDGVRMPGETGRHLALRNISRIERGRHYACAAQESRGLTSQTSSPVVLDVLYGPTSVELDPPTLLYQGAENSSLDDVTCSAVCNPSCSFRWLRGDGWVAGEGAVLRLARLERGKAGLYSCRAWNSLTFALSHNLSLLITEGDQVLTTPLACQQYVTTMTSEEAVTSLSVGAAVGVGFAVGVVTSAVVGVASFLLLRRTRKSPRRAAKDNGPDVYYNAREGIPRPLPAPEMGQSATGSPYESLDGASRLPPPDPSLYRDLTVYENPRDT